MKEFECGVEVGDCYHIISEDLSRCMDGCSFHEIPSVLVITGHNTTLDWWQYELTSHTVTDQRGACRPESIQAAVGCGEYIKISRAEYDRLRIEYSKYRMVASL